MLKKIATVVCALALAGVAAVQHGTLTVLRGDLAAVRQELAEMRGRPAERPSAPAALVAREPARVSSADAQLERRLASLEQSVAQLAEASRQLMERGQLRPDEEFLADMRRKLLDAAAPDRDRLNALRVLRRSGGGLDDAVLQQVAAWAQGAADGGVRENVLNTLEGMTNAVLRAAFLQMAATDAEADVREQAVDNLRRFVNDPQAEALLWDRLRNDPDERVRDEAASALRSGPFTEARLAALKARAASANAPLEERLLAWGALRNARVNTADINASFAQIAQSTTDPVERARLFRAFDGASDPAMIPPLVNGLLDPNPAIRQQAADSLSGLKTDATVQQWLRYISQTDPDPQVRREALQALEERGRR